MFNSIVKLLSKIIIWLIVLAILPFFLLLFVVVWALGIPITISGKNKVKIGELRWFTFTRTKE